MTKSTLTVSCRSVSEQSLLSLDSYLTVNGNSRQKQELFSKLLGLGGGWGGGVWVFLFCFGLFFVNVNVIENLKRDGHPFGTYTKGRHYSLMTFLFTRQLTEVGGPNLLIHGRYLRYIYFVRKVLIRFTIIAMI